MSGTPDRLEANLKRLTALVRGNLGDTDAHHPAIRSDGHKDDVEWYMFSRILQRLGLR